MVFFQRICRDHKIKEFFSLNLGPAGPNLTHFPHRTVEFFVFLRLKECLTFWPFSIFNLTMNHTAPILKISKKICAVKRKTLLFICAVGVRASFEQKRFCSVSDTVRSAFKNEIRKQ